MTAINLPTTKLTASGITNTPLQGNGNGVFTQAGGMGFFDAILAQIANGLDGADAKGQKTSLQTGGQDAGQNPKTPTLGNGTLKPAHDNPLALLQIALSSQKIDADGNIVLSDDTAGDMKDAVRDALDFTTALINHIKNAAPAAGEDGDLFKKIVAKLQAKSESLQTSLTALDAGMISKDMPLEDMPFPMMVALGLDPAEISDLSAKIGDLEEKLGRDVTVDDLISGVGGLLPTPPQETLVKTAAFSAGSSVELSSGNDAVPVNAAGNSLKDTLSGTPATSGDAANETANNSESAGKLVPALPAATIDVSSTQKKPEKSGASSAAPLDADENSIEPSTDETFVKDAANSKAPSAKPAASAVKENFAAFMSAQTARNAEQQTLSASQAQRTNDSALFAQNAGAPVPSYSQSAQASNIIVTSATAGQAHPAANMVGATLIKSAKTGETQTMTVRLDPPELGNVSVRLQFGKDKSVKAHITVEKSDTYTMLQRDSQTLERALQSAGFDAKTESISFELAQDNGTFARNRENDTSGDKNFGNAGNSSLSAETGTELETINTSVAWQVDSSTGRVRYNIFA